MSECHKIKEYAKIRNWSNQIPTPALKPKRVITNITNSQNTKITYGKPSEQLFPKRWPLGNRNRTKINMNTRRAKRHQKQVTEKPQKKTTALERKATNDKRKSK